MRITTEKVKPIITRGETEWVEFDITGDYSFRALWQYKVTFLHITPYENVNESSASFDNASQTQHVHTPLTMSSDTMVRRSTPTPSNNPVARPSNVSRKRRRSQFTADYEVSDESEHKVHSEDDEYAYAAVPSASRFIKLPSPQQSDSPNSKKVSRAVKG